MKKLAKSKDPLFSKVTSVRMAMPNVYFWEARKHTMESMTPDDAHTLLNILFALIQEADPKSTRKPGGASTRLQEMAGCAHSVKPVIDSLIFFGTQSPSFIKAIEKRTGTNIGKPRCSPALEIFHRDTLKNFWMCVDEAKQSGSDDHRLMGLALETAMGIFAAEATA